MKTLTGSRIIGKTISLLITLTLVISLFGITAVTASAGGDNREQLREDIQFATALHDRAVEGTLPGQYAAGSKAVFWSSIQAANAVVENETSTQAEVDQAAADLAEDRMHSRGQR